MGVWALLFSVKIKKNTSFTLTLHCTIYKVKNDLKSSGLHNGWHLQLKLIFYTKSKEQNYKIKKHYTKQKNKQQSYGLLLVKNYSFSARRYKTRGNYGS